MTTKLINNFSTTVDGAMTDSQTTVTLIDITGLSVLTVGDLFRLTLAAGAIREIILCTYAAATSTFNCVRGQENTTAVAWDDLSRIEGRITAASINERFETANPSAAGLGFLDTDVTLAANSDTKIPSQKAIKAYVLAAGGGAGGGGKDAYTTTATAAGTTTLTVSSNYQQFFTGSTTQTVQMPVVSTLTLGYSWLIVNNSTGAVTVNSSGSNAIVVIPANSEALLTCILITGTSAASWDYSLTTHSSLMTGSGKMVRDTSPTLITPALGTVASGDVSACTAVTAATASKIAQRDSSANLSANSMIEGYATTASAAGTTILTVASAQQQFITGSTTQTVRLPVTSTLVLGQVFWVVNNSSGNATVTSSGTNSIQVMAGSTAAKYTCILTSGTSAASWSVAYINAASSATALYSFRTQSSPPTLIAADNYYQIVTGSGGGSLNFPLESGMSNGKTFVIVNDQSSGTIALYSSGGGSICNLQIGWQATVTLVDSTTTAATAWRVTLTPISFTSTGTGNAVASNGPTFIAPHLGIVADGDVSACVGQITPTASVVMGYDANTNTHANNSIDAYATTATAAGTTTLTVTSKQQQFFTGSTTQNCKLPVVSTLELGLSYRIVNNSSGVVTVQSSGSNTIQAMAAGSSCIVTCILITGTSAASWSVAYFPSLSNSVTNGLTGVTTMTTAYAPVCAGTTAAGALQVASTGLSTSGFVLTSNGASAVPSFQAVPAGTVATQSDQETATSTATYVCPGRQQYHPSAAKAWAHFGVSGNILASYGVSSVTDTGAGAATVNFTTAFSSATYAVAGGIKINVGGQILHIATLATGTCLVNSVDPTGTPTDPVNYHTVFYGDQ